MTMSRELEEEIERCWEPLLACLNAIENELYNTSQTH